MRITEMKRLRRSLYQLYLDGAEGPQVDVKTADAAGCRVGGELTAEALERLLESSQYNRVRDKALYLLGLRDYGQAELTRKLSLETSTAVATAVTARLAEVGLLDDRRYAMAMARSLSEYKLYPRRRIVQDLQCRGIARELAEEAAASIENDDFQQALALLEKKYYNKMNTPEERRHTMAALARRGFPYGAVRQAMEAFAVGETETESDNEEYDDLWQ